MNKELGKLIHEKITVPDETPRVSRKRLLTLLDRNLTSYNATVINGRAGTGKTTLAADFARHTGRPVSWYKVDAADSDLSVFCEYLAATLRLQRTSITPHRLLDLAETGAANTAELLAAAFVFQLSESKAEPLLIVIEDLHLVYDAPWIVPFFQRLLPLLPVDVHLLVTCRSLPPAPLWRMRSKQMLRVLDETELAFTMDEAVRLFETYGLSEEHAQAGMRETSGRTGAITRFASTPGQAGRALADSFLGIRRVELNSLVPTPEF